MPLTRALAVEICDNIALLLRPHLAESGALVTDTNQSTPPESNSSSELNSSMLDESKDNESEIDSISNCHILDWRSTNGPGHVSSGHANSNITRYFF